MKREKLIEETMKAYEEEFLKINGFSMNRQQRRALLKKVETFVDKELKKQF